MRRERGQATVEWIALVLLAALLLLGLLAAAGGRLPGGELARSILGRIVCAVRLDGSCGDDGAAALALAYGNELAATIREHAPDLLFEEGMVALPVDYRRCREPACSDGPETGTVTRSTSGERVVAFVHVIDCRAAAIAESREAGYDCTGEREGNLYLQFFFYYPTSSTTKAIPGDVGFHPDDWESLHVRIGPDGTAYVRASSHKGYNYEYSRLNSGSDAGGRRRQRHRRGDRRPPQGRLGPEHRPAPRLRRQPRGQRQARRLHPRPNHPRPPPQPDPDRVPLGTATATPLRGHPALAQARLQRPESEET